MPKNDLYAPYAPMPPRAHRRRNMKKGPTEVGPLQVQLRRISAQPHRCNGKSFQYPPNVIILLIIYFLWVCYSVVLVLEHYARFIGLRKSKRPPIGRCSHFFHFVRHTPERNMKTSHIVRYGRPYVHSNTALGVSQNTSAQHVPAARRTQPARPGHPNRRRLHRSPEPRPS